MEKQKLLESEESTLKVAKNPQLKQAFSKAKLFEIRRLVRRIKQLSAKKGTTQQLEKNKRKVARLEKQLEVIKDLHVDTFKKAAAAKVQGEELHGVDLMHMSADEEDVGTRINVLERILNVIGEDKIKDLSSAAKSKKMKIKSIHKEKTIKTIQTSPKNTPKFSKKPNLDTDSFRDETEKDQKLENLDDFFSDPIAQDCNQGDLCEEKAYKRRKITLKDDLDEIPSKAFDSVFVGSLKSGKQKNGKNKRKSFKEKSANRLGQRERRKQWEKLYGNRANHLKKEKEILKHSNEEDIKKIRNKSFQERKKKHLNEKTDSFLHPSWEASKSKRKQESIVEFKGQKITFED